MANPSRSARLQDTRTRGTSSSRIFPPTEHFERKPGGRCNCLLATRRVPYYSLGIYLGRIGQPPPLYMGEGAQRRMEPRVEV